MSNCKIPIYFPCTYVFITHATSCRGYNVLDPSVSPMYFIVSASLLEPLNRISRNFLVMKNIFCRCRTCAYIQDVLIHFFFLELPPFWNFAKVKYTSKIFCPSNSSETVQQNFVKSCSWQGHNVYICTFAGSNDDLILFWGNNENFCQNILRFRVACVKPVKHE